MSATGINHFIHTLSARGWTFLLLWSAFLILPLLGYSQIFQVSEAREGVVVDEILASGDLVLPKRNGEIVPSKPILFHWIGAATAVVLGGDVDEFVLRFPSAVGACGMVLATYWLAGAFLGGAPRLLAPLLLLSTYGFYRLAHDGRVDMLFNAFVVAALGAFLREAARLRLSGRSLREIGAREMLLVSAFTGFAVLAKGPLGLALVGLVVLAVAVFEERWHGVLALVRKEWALAILLPLPWYVLATLAESKDFLGRQVFFENVLRFTGGEGITVKPFWFYLPHFFGQGAPWSLVFGLYVFFLLRAEWRRRKRKGGANTFLPQEAALRRGLLYGLIWIGILLLFFSVSAGKRRGYLLPILPPVALVIAIRLSATWERLRKTENLGRIAALLKYETFCWGALVWLVLTVAGVVAIGLNEELQVVSSFFPKAKAIFEALAISFARGRESIIMYMVLLGGGSLALWIFAFRRRSLPLSVFAIILFAQYILTVFVSVGFGVRGITHSYKDFALQVARSVPESRPIHFVKMRKDESFDGFFFYFKRHVVFQDPSERHLSPGLYLARRGWLDGLEPEKKEPIVEMISGGRQADEEDERLVLFYSEN